MLRYTLDTILMTSLASVTSMASVPPIVLAVECVGKVSDVDLYSKCDVFSLCTQIVKYASDLAETTPVCTRCGSYEKIMKFTPPGMTAGGKVMPLFDMLKTHNTVDVLQRNFLITFNSKQSLCHKCTK